MTTIPTYSPPLDRLLPLGRPESDWLDYHTLGIGPEHVADLIRVVRDPAWHELDPESPAVYTDIHAWRALGQLRAVEAVEALLEALDCDLAEDGDWASEELPRVFGAI